MTLSLSMGRTGHHEEHEGHEGHEVWITARAKKAFPFAAFAPLRELSYPQSL